MSLVDALLAESGWEGGGRPARQTMRRVRPLAVPSSENSVTEQMVALTASGNGQQVSHRSPLQSITIYLSTS